jgi:quinoprotein glucose dehydrogenase
MPRVTHWIAAATSACAIAAAASVLSGAQESAARREWRYFGGDRAHTRYSPLDQINKNNVASLRIAWRRPAYSDSVRAAFPDLRVNPYLRSTPVFVNGVLYTQGGSGLVMALDPETGRVLWEQQLFSQSREEAAGVSTRGVDYWSPGGDAREGRIIALRGEYLYSVDAATGAPSEGFGARGRARLAFDHALAGRFADSTGPLVVGNVIVVTGNTNGAGDHGNKKEAAPENVRGYDVRTGQLLWTFNVVPQPGEFGNETWGNDSWKYAGDLGAWNQMTADEELGYVYIPLTAPTSAWYGGWRPGDNLFSNSIVALDAKSGRRVWHFQTVHHDLWDSENVGPAMLGDITVDGRRIKALMQPNKNAFLFVLDRTNGKPVWPIEERPVPKSTVPGEVSSPTQPFPTKPPAFDRQGITEADLIDYTPELKAKALDMAKDYVFGPMFTPPILVTGAPGEKKGALQMPGSWGSANWNTGAFDPETGIYYAVSQTMGPAARSVAKQTGTGHTMEYAEVVNTPPRVEGLPFVKGPYGRITALDLNTGTQKWMAVNGDGPRTHPLLQSLNLPPLGVPNRPAPLLTKTLLFLGEGSNAISGTIDEPWGWGKKFRAYDKSTGKVIAELDLPSGTTAGPMTYEVKGKQYIVVAVGDKSHAPEFVALTLP